MALINYPPIQHNFWSQQVPDKSAQMYLQAKMAFDRNQTQLFGLLGNIMRELDPVTLMTDKHRILQAQKIKNIEDYVTELYKNARRRGRLTQDDLMNVQWQVEKYNAWEAGALSGIEQFKKKKDIYEKAPKGYYDPSVFFAGMEYFMRTGEDPPGGYLKIMPGDLYGDVSKLKPFDEKGFTYTKEGTEVIDGKLQDVKKQWTEYGVLDYDANGAPIGVNKKETRKRKEALVMSFILSDPQYMAAAEEDFNQLQLRDPELREMYVDMAKAYKAEAKAKGFLDQIEGQERQYPPEVNPAYLYARDKGIKLIQPAGQAKREITNLPSGLRTAMYKEAHKEDVKKVQQPAKYQTTDGDYLIMDVTDKNGFDSNVMVGRGGKNLRKPAANAEFFGGTATYSPIEPPKNRVYTVDNNTVFVGMPLNSDEWDYKYIGKSVRSWQDELGKSKIGQSFDIDSYNIFENVSTYMGSDEITIPRYEKDINGNLVKTKLNYTVAYGMPISDGIEQSMIEEYGPKWDEALPIEEKDFAVINAIGGMKSQTPKSVRFATMLNKKVMQELGLKTGGGPEQPQPAKEDVYISNNNEYSREELVAILMDSGYTEEEAEAELDRSVDAGEITIKE